MLNNPTFFILKNLTRLYKIKEEISNCCYTQKKQFITMTCDHRSIEFVIGCDLPDI